MTVSVLLLRHGQSVWNAAGRWQGTADPPLSRLGVRQAEVAAERLAALGLAFEAAWSSDLERARDTAVALARGVGLERVETFEGLRERYAGAWQGLTRAEIDRDYPGYLDQGRRPDGFETDEEVLGRVRPTLAESARSVASGPVVAVAHGGVVISLDVAHDGFEQRYPNLTGRWWHVDGERFTPGDRVELIPPGEDLGLE